MDKEEALRLILRNAEEVVREEELTALLEEGRAPRAYTGYEPSGKIHMGHMLTVSKLLDLQRAGFKIVVLLADLHGYLNEKGSLEDVQRTAEMNREAFIALGLDPDETEFVNGSSFQLEEDYMLNVLRLARDTTLNRARRSMDEVSRSLENPKVSQMIYPLMQAMDIAWLDVDLAVGGIDQRKIHMLAREGLPRLGFKAPVCLHTPILLGLDGEKMSSSLGNYISVDDDEDAIKKKIRGAFCPAKVVDGNPVLEIFRYHIFPRFETITIERPEKYGGNLEIESFNALVEVFRRGELHPMDLKNAASSYLEMIIGPVRSRLSEVK
ncbi:MAG TPA: tyrosine--tRNA ligase [Candidatus Syntrophoarchaeum butanivorans]|uniref:Tyrosine--tRNA ligase n=1 Tax=Candidatus Syntropharchaeum butanivorans TaxID=1839936 RepID=A0A7C0X099_9EURY|nr:MAG: tyrosine--tRNA ligase [Candidatus Syntrophoarchaeum sp. WYZ-LMO15]HDM35705.1 tyrosine--tRNA ligase [Candidatus Syntrophoarchaeum butanivorans]